MPSQFASSIILATHNAGTQSLSGSSWTQRTFDTVDKDSGGYWASNTYTPLVAGWYLATYLDAIATPNGTFNYANAIYKNGSLYVANYQFTSTSTYILSFNSTAIIQMNGSTDALTFYMYNGGGSTGTAQGTGYSFVSIIRVF